LGKIGGQLLITALHMIENEYFIPHVQDRKGVVYANKLTREDEKISWSDSAWLTHCKIRALSPKPGAYFIDKQQNNIKIIRSSYKSGDDAYAYLEEMSSNAAHLPLRQQIDIEQYLQAPHGFVLNKMLATKCGDGGIIFPQILQRPGGKAMPVQDFILGYEIAVGEILR
jgi:methionyl-tRNA formyltransferase